MLKVSVIIPVYNRENLIKRCLDSCINQTMSESDYEIIVVDDCSTDGTYVNICSYRDNYPNLIKILQLPKNSGNASAPRNAGMDIATGEYIFFVDSDDYIDEETLLDGYNLGSENDSDIVFVKRVSYDSKNGNFEPFRKKIFGNDFVTQYGDRSGNISITSLDKITELYGATSSFYKRTQVEKLGVRFEPMITLGEDWLFTNIFLLRIEHIKISVLARKDYYFYIVGMGEWIEGGEHLTDAKLTLEDSLYRLRKWCEVLFASNKKDISKYENMHFTHLIPSVVLSVQKSQTEKSERKYIRYRNVDENILAAFSKVCNECIPVWADKFLPPQDTFILKAIRDNDKEALIKYEDYNNEIDKLRSISKWINGHEYPPYQNDEVMHDIILFGWYYNDNIGGSLNFYALHELLKSAKFDIVVAKTRKDEDINAGRKLQFDIVSEYYHFTDYYPDNHWYKARNFAKIFVAASDQLWNGKYFSGTSFMTSYLGGGNGRKKISVATSFGEDTHRYTPAQLPIVQHLFNKFNHISVREDSGVDILSGLGVEGASCILDSVFLCSPKAFELLEDKSSYRNESDFVFAYILDATKELADCFIRIKEKLGVSKAHDMTTIGSTEYHVADKSALWATFDGVEFHPDATSADFLYNIKRADFVFTDSYHGACFAILAKKPFILVRNKKRGNARYKLFKKLGLENRIIDIENLSSVDELIDKPIAWWKVIDFKKETISISKQLQYIPELGMVDTDTTKSESGNRIISIPPMLADLLQEYKAWQEDEKIKLGDKWIESGKLFTQENGERIFPDTPSKWFHKFVKKHNLPPLTFHQLRHTNASLLISQNVDIATVANRLGHADKAITLRTYTHAIKEQDREAADKLQNLIKKKK